MCNALCLHTGGAHGRTTLGSLNPSLPSGWARTTTSRHGQATVETYVWGARTCDITSAWVSTFPPFVTSCCGHVALCSVDRFLFYPLTFALVGFGGIQAAVGSLVAEHPRPGPISSADLEDTKQPGALKPDIRLGVDYVVWPEAMWMRMSELYGSTNSVSAVFRRRLIADVPAPAGATATTSDEDSAQPAVAPSSIATAMVPRGGDGEGGAATEDNGAAATAAEAAVVGVAAARDEPTMVGAPPGNDGSLQAPPAEPESQAAPSVVVSATIHVRSTAPEAESKGGEGGTQDDASQHASTQLHLELYPCVCFVSRCSEHGRPVVRSAIPVFVR